MQKIIWLPTWIYEICLRFIYVTSEKYIFPFNIAKLFKHSQTHFADRSSELAGITIKVISKQSVFHFLNNCISCWVIFNLCFMTTFLRLSCLEIWFETLTLTTFSKRYLYQKVRNSQFHNFWIRTPPSFMCLGITNKLRNLLEIKKFLICCAVFRYI